jgi:hypothetical protein
LWQERYPHLSSSERGRYLFELFGSCPAAPDQPSSPFLALNPCHRCDFFTFITLFFNLDEKWKNGAKNAAVSNSVYLKN